MKEAARASMTYSYFNPHNIQILRNTNFYKTLQDVTDKDLVSIETLDYVSSLSSSFIIGGKTPYYIHNMHSILLHGSAPPSQC